MATRVLVWEGPCGEFELTEVQEDEVSPSEEPDFTNELYVPVNRKLRDARIRELIRNHRPFFGQ